MPLAIQLFDAVQVTWNATPLKFATEHTRALLAYLAVEADVVHRRLTLATLLWPEENEATARHNLRQALFFLKRALGAVAGHETPLQVTPTTVQWNSQGVELDLYAFQHLWRLSQTHHHAEIAQCVTCIDYFTQALALYQGEFLQGLWLKASQPFEEWTLFLREQAHRQASTMLAVLTNHHLTQGAYDQAQHYAARLVALEPWHEEGHRALMRALAAQGRQIAALRQYETCRRMLQDELGVPPSAETIALYEAIRRGELDKGTGRGGGKETRREQVAAALPVASSPPVPSSPSLPVSAAPPHNLPDPLTPFVGHTHALADIHRRLQQGVRLLTLVGAGGMGKTRLALEAARQTLAAYPHGVVFVALAALTSPSALAIAIATAVTATFGVSLQEGDSATVLGQFLRSRRLLLILDNFEQLLIGSTEAVALVTALLQAAPQVQILVTSRERLQLRSEQLFQVQPLTVTGQASLAEAAAMPAVQLFVQSAQFVQADFQLTSTNLAAVLRICQLVQGMPLGLELAAAQVGVLSLRVIADAIQQSATFLAVDWHDLPARQRSLRAVFGWSWQLLTTEEQRVLRQISIFHGGFDLMAAQNVAGATRPLLNRLCHKSLLQWQETANERGRYIMHELLRQFTAEKLRDAGEEPAVALQHGHYYLAYLAVRGPRLGRLEAKEASAEIQAELDNIRLAWQWAAVQGQLAEIDQATYSWWQFCFWQWLRAEARLSFAQAIASVRQQIAANEEASATHLASQRLLAKLLAIHASFFAKQEMATQAREAVALGGASGGFDGETFGTFVLGCALQDLGQYQEAGTMWRQTLQLVWRYQPNHPESELLHEAHWCAHYWLRDNALYFDDYAGSRAAITQALQICQMLGKRQGELTCLYSLAQLNFFLYDFTAAESGFAATLVLARALNYRRIETLAQAGLAEVARQRADYITARTLLEQSITTATELAFPYNAALSLAALIRLHCELGNQAAATQCNEQLTQLLARVNLPTECQLAVRLAAARQAHSTGDHSIALHHAEQAVRLNERGGLLFRRGDTALMLGHIHAAAAQWELAVAAFQQALTAFQPFVSAPMARALTVEPQAGLAQIALAQGALADALGLVEAILPILTEQPHAGYSNPFFIYLTCYQVLVAHADPRAAKVLQQGYDLLQQEAAKLDEATRRGFLEAVPAQRALVTAYQNMMAEERMR